MKIFLFFFHKIANSFLPRKFNTNWPPSEARRLPLTCNLLSGARGGHDPYRVSTPFIPMDIGTQGFRFPPREQSSLLAPVKLEDLLCPGWESPSNFSRRHSKNSGHQISDTRFCERKPEICSIPAQKLRFCARGGNRTHIPFETRF